MRLKEPLYGLRVAQLHFIMHVSMALTMVWLESQFQPSDYRNDVQYEGLLKQLCATKGADAGGPGTHSAIILMKQENTQRGFDPLGFYKRAYIHITQNEPWFQILAGDISHYEKYSGRYRTDHYPLQDMTIFILFHAAHVICAFFQIARTYNESSQSFGILHGLVTQIFAVTFYFVMVIYAIYKNRMISGGQNYGDCDTLAEGWLRFEVRVFLFWLVACSIFLAGASLFRLQSKWKQQEESLKLQTIWRTKNSMDYLHYMQIEQENFNLIAGPLLADGISFVLNERKEGGAADVATISACIAIRLLLLIGFLYNLSYSVKGQVGFWRGYYIFTICLYVGALIAFIALSLDEKSRNVTPQAIRRATNQSEMVALPILIAYQVYMYYFIKGKLHSVKEKSIEIVAQREEKFGTMIRQAETHFLGLHNIAAAEAEARADEGGAGPPIRKAPSQVFAEAPIGQGSREEPAEGEDEDAGRIRQRNFQSELVKDLMSGGEELRQLKKEKQIEEAIHPMFKSAAYVSQIGALQVHYMSGTLGDQKIAHAMHKIFRQLERDWTLQQRMADLRFMMDSGIADFFQYQPQDQGQEEAQAARSKKRVQKSISQRYARQKSRVSMKGGEIAGGAFGLDDDINSQGDSEDEDPVPFVGQVAAGINQTVKDEPTNAEETAVVHSDASIRHMITDKSHIILHQNAYELTMLAFLKKAAAENEIDVHKQSEYVIYYGLVAFVQVGMMLCMYFAIINNHIDYRIYASAWYTILFAKFVASCALHLIIYPEISRSMQLMKYTTNHAELFTHPNIAFAVPFMAHNINILAEALNLFQLLFWSSVEYTIVYFVAMSILVQIPHIYIDSLMDDKLKDKLFEEYAQLEIEKSGKHIAWSSRSWSNKAGRIAYRFHRAFYVSVIFYFQPFILIFAYRFLVKDGELDPNPKDA